MRTYFLSALAEADIDDIVSYIAHENKRAGLTLLDAIYEAMDMLALHPTMGYKREFIHDPSVRFWPFKWHYLIIYRDTFPIEIIRVLSGYRDIVNLLN